MKLSERLQSMGIETYCPTVKTIRQWSDRKKKIAEPLFKSYVFVRPTARQVEQIHFVPGFSRFVYWLGEPVKVRHSEIIATRDFLNKVVHDSISVCHIKVGKTVKMGIGPLKDVSGKILEINQNQAILQIDTLGTLVKAKVALTDLVV